MKISTNLTTLKAAKKMFILIVASTVCSLSSVGWGEESKSNLLEVQFEDLDADKNGVISIDEFINTPLGIIKKNDLRKLVRHKIPKESLKEGEVHFLLTADEKSELFESLDRDKDNTISRKEWVIFKDGKFMF